MKRNLAFIFLLNSLVFGFATNGQAAGQFRVKVKFLEVANLTYQLDCVGNLPVNCSAKRLNSVIILPNKRTRCFARPKSPRR